MNEEWIGIQESVDILSLGIETLSDDCIRLRSEHNQMKTTGELSVSQSSNPKLLDATGTMTFPFNKHHSDINSPFSMYSQTFKTSPFGYSFILHVCSTMDFTTNENKEYLSIYIALLRSDFDSILFYPFPYNIFLSLCDQSGQGKHITSIIISDPKSSSFARPTSEKNNEVGVVKFCPLNYLRNAESIYLKDGVFFIRVFIDFLNTGAM
jgi:hypothetical protein